MKIIIVLTYPVYHDFAKPMDILTEPFREHQMARILAERGHETELWYIGKHPASHPRSREMPYTVRMFKSSRTKGPTKLHFSSDMPEIARKSGGDLFLLKGVDGGGGLHLLKSYILPRKKTFGFIIGGHSRSSYFKNADVIFYESEFQRQYLISHHRFLRNNKNSQDKLIFLPKSVDTDLFSPPAPSSEKEWDILVVGRLISYYKNYKAAGTLSRYCRIAVAGGGSDAGKLKSNYPLIQWLGEIPNKQLASYYGRSHLFLYPGFNDYFPRVIAESMSCGVPPLAFTRRIQPDVVPADCGLLLPRRNYIAPVRELLKKPDQITIMGQRSREAAVQNMGKNSTRDALEKMVDMLATSEGNIQ